ncbi:murein L,D-transpeptidase catalytic domain-containing protein [Cytophaga aurantiaca]|uniref:murein L,D-transpeptidase catalytic domain-containing protein n=1 Tax=Cytophaga aurantiaca TaxID=29530 RepID=UPI001FE0ECC6|nr:murein L,D-transpeptidase catalytic domain family protein [Cytophaga aurantiaca]
MNRYRIDFRLSHIHHSFTMLFIIFFCFVLLSACSDEKKNTVYEKVDSSKVAQAFKFCKKNGYDTSTCFFIDMSIHSGKNRFFVWNFKTKKIAYEGLCCHGVGKGSTTSTPVFSNENGSNCTSLGKYKVGIRSYSNWGIHAHYKLHGLESSNSNAYSRIVVLHSHDPVSETEIYPFHLSMGWSLGCPVVSNKFMRRLDGLLKNKKKPTLLWIYK